MKSNKKIILTMLLTFIMLMNLVGCANGIGGNDAESKSDKSTQMEQSTSFGINEEATKTYGDLSKFKTTTLDGKEFSQDDFKNYDITMVNFWATFCGACVDEMPEIAELYNTLPKNVNIVAICSDAEGNEELAKNIVKESNISFTVLKNSKDLDNGILKNVMYVPMTIFVDKDGNIVGDIVDGAPENVKKEYTKSINKALEAVGKDPIGINESDNNEENASNVVAAGSKSDEDEYVLPDNLDDYIYGFESKLSDKVKKKLETKYDKLISNYNEEKINEDELYTKLSALDKELRNNGVYLPFATFEDLLDSIEGISEKDKNYLLKNEDVILENDENISEKKAEKVYEKAEKILKKYGVDLYEATEQLITYNVKNAVFNIEGSQINYDKGKTANGLNLSSKTITTYKNIIKEVKTLIPNSIWSDITAVEINTDGIEEVMAHTIPAIDGFEKGKFRLAIDLSDVADAKGNLTKDGKETIVHETGHILTLSNEQVNEISWDGDGSEKAKEKFKANSYIKKFYDEFWSKNIDEYNVSKEKTGDTIEFYDNRKNEFVSDYAATNVEEDIAESFRIFVCEDKPKGKTIADKKVLFFYDYPEFIKLRDEYRVHL